jgi:RecQ-mediated genome instability protein 2
VDGKVWIQGVLISVRDEKDVTWYTVDDGTGVLAAKLSAAARQRVMTPGERGAPGDYVLIVGKVKAHAKLGRIVLLHTVIDLSAQPDREAVWSMQVIEATKAGAW